MEKPKTRREVLKEGAAAALTAVPVYGMGSGKAEAGECREDLSQGPAYEPAEWASIEPTPVHARQGEFINPEELLMPELPTPNPREVLGSSTGLIISKRFHRFWLFKDGKLLKLGPIGTARRPDYDTPEGLYIVEWQEDGNYSSKEFPGYNPDIPNMAFATFFVQCRGIAIHGSLNFVTRVRADGSTVERLLLDSSHGCVNARRADAELVYNTLKKYDKVAVLP